MPDKTSLARGERRQGDVCFLIHTSGRLREKGKCSTAQFVIPQPSLASRE